jgi:hypothetical protein
MGCQLVLSIVAGIFFDQHLLKTTNILSVPLVKEGD